MLPIPDSIIQEAMKQTGQEPAIFLDVFADRGQSSKIDSESQWKGTDDPMVGADSNVSATRIPGSIVLAEGAAVAAVYTGPDQLAGAMTYQASVGDRWHTEGNFLTGTRKVHDYWVRLELQVDASIQIPFTAQSTLLVDELILRAVRSGNLDRQVYVRYLDTEGTQIGNQVFASLTLAVASHQITGLAASLTIGRNYVLEVGYDEPSLASLPGVLLNPNFIHTSTISFYGYTVASAFWKVPTGNGDISIGGNEGYAAAGAFVRQLDVGTVPLDDGTINWSDIVLSGTSMAVDLYYTDDDVIAQQAVMDNWTLHGSGVRSGDTIPPHRYWRISVTMNANGAADASPLLQSVSLNYRGTPVTIGTHAEANSMTDKGYPLAFDLPLLPITFSRTWRTGVKALHSVSSSSAQLSPKIVDSMVGKISADIAPEDEIHDLMSYPLRGSECVLRAGFRFEDGHIETHPVFEGIVTDMGYEKNRYRLTFLDDLELADVRVPRDKAGDVWSGATDYSVSDVVVHGTNSWLALLASGPGNGGAVEPGTDPAVWQDNGTVWNDIAYTPLTNGGQPWHLVDIAKGLILNRINIATERVNLDSFEVVRALFPNRTGERTLTKPTSAKKMLSELAWLLESQWVMRAGRMTLFAEPPIGASPVETITSRDIKADLVFRRGWKELKNEILILSGYSGDGDGDEHFSLGVGLGDETSITDHRMTAFELFRDKWGVPESELIARSTNFINRYKNGRRVVSFSASQRLLRLEPGDVVFVHSTQLPPAEHGGFKAMVTRRDVKKPLQGLSLTLLEV